LAAFFSCWLSSPKHTKLPQTLVFIHHLPKK